MGTSNGRTDGYSVLRGEVLVCSATPTQPGAEKGNGVMKNPNSQQQRSSNCIHVLYIDDNADDLLLLQQAIQAAAVHEMRVQCLPSLAQAMTYLNGGGEFSNRAQYPMPDLILLDFEIGAQTGPALLKWMRTRHELSLIPITMFSGSDSAEPIARSYEAGACCFIRKPIGMERLNAFVGALHRCFSSVPPAFQALGELPEYRAYPGIRSTSPAPSVLP